MKQREEEKKTWWQRKKERKLTVIPQSPVFGVVYEIVILELSPPAGLGELKGLAHETRPVDDGGCEVARVDDVEFLLEGPGFLGVVDFEFHVGGNPGEVVNSGDGEWMDVEEQGGLDLDGTKRDGTGVDFSIYQDGCVGLRSVPTISVSGWSSPVG